MKSSDFTDPATGTLVPSLHNQVAFVPADLPPSIDLAPVQQLLSRADRDIGELKGIGKYLPNPYLLIRPLQRSEAIASSNIEGTYTSLSELILLEAGIEDDQRRSDTFEVFNYVNALKRGQELLADLPVSNRVVLALHETLLNRLPRSRRGHFAPGEFRDDQNYIGRQRDIANARFVPPPPPIHLECMNRLERFINHPNIGGFPPLVFIALVHYQFETIHPFPDGNGRVGRLLIPLLLESYGVMDQPLLYMSPFFEDRRDEYVDLMLAVSQQGAWTDWIGFFLEGVIASCQETIATIERINALRQKYQDRCSQARSSALLMRIIDNLFEQPVTTIPGTQRLTGLSYRAAQNNIERLVSYGVLMPGPAWRRPRYFVASELIQAFES